ncbi:MAG TPA: hypothetical protein VG821_01930 [Rhizomicrobium sp.]|jgi:hypothetical protein|nr:hypothetical protein [Rhizomicrobium sp.]
MTDALPISQSTNLARLGNAGDTVTFAADKDQCAAIARWSGVLSLDRFEVVVNIAKLGATRFGLDFTVTAGLAQACVVTLEPVPAQLATSFHRELHFTGPARRKPPQADSAPEVVIDTAEEEGPEEIESLHYDLAVPALEEYVLALEPYPRCPGVEFAAPGGPQAPESPFAVLKNLKSGL